MSPAADWALDRGPTSNTIASAGDHCAATLTAVDENAVA
jgi:hypothetical protein